eukprot:Plantae.Rhodophyta-Purpureofilum_apyrenoidigerum.ctg4460.p1 GENE.Plantae.Rhodophyta-Purpureofilum_apyrenoidigerum.ctg4460~~Plantae.Rhodophyta-Purpureofilum_apyrenoidigerum.ctg4460.p1  ORF type:complete len:406 (-),score=65.53 Plantae.Rhodophyta-Purpureofilum_apyrenoidigerum.ctg4460:107-1324(-)
MIKIFRRGSGAKNDALEDRMDKIRDAPPDKLPLPSLHDEEPEGTLNGLRPMRLSWLGKKRGSDSDKNSGIFIETVTERIYDDDDRTGDFISSGFAVGSDRVSTRTNGKPSLGSRHSSSLSADGSNSKRMDSFLSGTELNSSTGIIRESSETPILQLPETDSPELIYQQFLAFAEPEVIEDEEGEVYESVNEPGRIITWSPTGADPAKKEIKISKTPICEFSRGRVIDVVGPDDLLVEVIPTKITTDIMDAFNHVVTLRCQNPEAAAASEAAQLLNSFNYGVKSNGNLSKIFRVRLAGTISPRPDQHYYDEASKFLNKNIKGHRVTVTVYGADAFGRAIADLVLVKINKSVSRALVKVGILWHYPPFDINSELKDIMKEAKEAKRGLWAGDQRPRAPWKKLGVATA